MSMSLPKISLWGRIVSWLAPRSCAVCGTRLEPQEDIVCACCNLHLPRTNYAVAPYDNEMAQLFWGRVPVERCAALLHDQAAAPASALLQAEIRQSTRLGCGTGTADGQRTAANRFLRRHRLHRASALGTTADAAKRI